MDILQRGPQHAEASQQQQIAANRHTPKHHPADVQSDDRQCLDADQLKIPRIERVEQGPRRSIKVRPARLEPPRVDQSDEVSHNHRQIKEPR